MRLVIEKETKNIPIPHLSVKLSNIVKAYLESIFIFPQHVTDLLRIIEFTARQEFFEFSNSIAEKSVDFYRLITHQFV